MVETAIVDQKRLVLVRRDDVEHLIIVGGPVDMVVETGIKGRPHLEPPPKTSSSPTTTPVPPQICQK